MKKQKKTSSSKIDLLLNIALVFILILVITNLYLIKLRSENIKESQEILKESQRPAVLEITKLLVKDCNDCYDINKALDELKKQNINITKEETLTESQLIEEYGITKLPALIIKGEINKTEQLNNIFKNNGKIINENTAIFTNIKPPYLDLNNDKIVGRVSIINILDSSCTKCSSLFSIPLSLAEIGVSITKEKRYDYNSAEGQKLINSNEIKRIPAILISDEIDYYAEVKEQLLKISAIKRNNYYAVHAQNPPYRNLTEDKIVGLVDLINLKDDSCSECYDLSVNKDVLDRFGIVINTENSYDINSAEGKELIEKYKIEKVPIIILSPDTSYYNVFLTAWEQVGSVEDDGWYVMRSPDIIGTYKDLTTNKVIEQENEQ